MKTDSPTNELGDHTSCEPDPNETTRQTPPNLALIRTDLANERTLLAYGRTALMLVGTGVSLIKFLDRSLDLVLLGWGLMAFGFAVGAAGVYRFTRLKRELETAHNRR